MRRSIKAIPHRPLVTTFNKRHGQHHVGAQEYPRQLRPELLRQRAARARKKHLARHSVCGQSRHGLQGFLNGNQKNPAAGFARPFGNWPSDITTALNEFPLLLRRTAGSL